MLIVEYYHNNIMLIKVIIPCHLDSLRLKRKVLINIEGLPMIEHVRRRVLLAEEIDEVLIATGDSEIKDIVESFGGKVIFTNNLHQNGTSRVFEAISKINCSHVLLVQGDEPLLIPSYLDFFIKSIKESKDEMMWNAISEINNPDDINDENKVKCILNIKNQIIFCFRKSPVSNSNYNKNIYKIQGLIAFKKETLAEIVTSKNTNFSYLESIEQMKAIENGIKIKAVKLAESLPSVNDIDELRLVKKILLEDQNQISLLKTISNESFKKN
ncbi:MAG: hypothetical protein CBC28_07000 [Flavobacteriaceae bacterium TMED68]|nr:MAG: hypothetical protein CBC28_07000 [Flavobacteriaceae bacterium TMED68]